MPLSLLAQSYKGPALSECRCTMPSRGPSPGWSAVDSGTHLSVEEGRTHEIPVMAAFTWSPGFLG